MIWRRRKQLILALLCVLLLLWGYDRLVKTHWVGSTDLVVEFVVTDAITGNPVPPCSD